jgi:hypothetical protein
MHKARAGGLAVLALVVAGCSTEAATAERLPAPVASPTPVVAATTEPPEPEPEPEPERTADPEQARLDELRAGDAFEALAEHDRAATAEWARFAWDEFTLSTNAEGVREEWTNKAELWDELMPPIRDACLLAGDEARDLIWDIQLMIPVSVNPRWSDVSTEGRGDLIVVVCSLGGVGEPTRERYFAALVERDEAGAGSVARRMEPFDISEEDAETQAAADDLAGLRLWAWVVSS